MFEKQRYITELESKQKELYKIIAERDEEIREYDNKSSVNNSTFDSDSLIKKNQELMNLVEEMKVKNRNLNEYENAVALLTTEIERLNIIKSNKTKEISNLKTRNSKLENRLSVIDPDILKKLQNEYN